MTGRAANTLTRTITCPCRSQEWRMIGHGITCDSFLGSASIVCFPNAGRARGDELESPGSITGVLPCYIIDQCYWVIRPPFPFYFPTVNSMGDSPVA